MNLKIFVLAGQEYDDVRLSREEFPKIKAEMPFGQIPVLEVDGKKLAQSSAIARYVARQFGYAGKNAFDEALVDSLVDQWKDFFNEARPYFMVLLGFQEGDADAVAKQLVLPAREKFFTFITKFIKNSNSGFLVGDSVTWVDLIVAELATQYELVPDFYKGFPEVKAHSEKVRSLPALKKWIETRPDTPF
ncbi:unnamed protein product [Nippostrongylus brasiliensis]|uniref:glutathione transferase n=1 Tax=Nippostrongylus brasiliensis TaxID=27835 RepID=A0A0N4YKR5_NIPBR|nr:unnamed protein product [Nippostrongylus brasiliensis]